MTTIEKSEQRKPLRSQDLMYNTEKLKARQQAHLKNLRELSKQGIHAKKKPANPIKRWFGYA